MNLLFTDDNIPTLIGLIVCLYDAIGQEIQKKSKIAVMTNPYWPFWNKSSWKFALSTQWAGQTVENKKKWSWESKQAAHSILCAHALQEH